MPPALGRCCARRLPRGWPTPSTSPTGPAPGRIWRRCPPPHCCAGRHRAGAADSPCATATGWRCRATCSAPPRSASPTSSACMATIRQSGDQPEAKAVYDIDSRTLMATARRLRDEGSCPPAAPSSRGRGSSSAPPTRRSTRRPAGSRTGSRPSSPPAPISCRPSSASTCPAAPLSGARLRDHGLLARLRILVGIGPLASAKSARWMIAKLLRRAHPARPSSQRLERAADPRAEGRRICVELLQELAEIDGVAGAHLMAPRGEAAIAEAIAKSGLLARRAAA